MCKIDLKQKNENFSLQSRLSEYAFASWIDFYCNIHYNDLILLPQKPMPSKKASSSKKQSALSKVQSLYVMQVELWDFLDDQEADKTKAETVQKTLKEFNSLLKDVDWQYMGGEEVLETLQSIPQQVNKKLKLKSGNKKTITKKKSTTKKTVATARKQAKKPSAKKSTKKKNRKK